jgi:hypothetical protein
MGRKVAEFAGEAADREAIRDCLTRYSRGADRIDRQVMLDAFWPDATDNHGGIFAGSAADLIEYVLPVLQGLEHTTHFLGNMLIEIDGERARCETYVLAIYAQRQQAALTHIVVGGRYLDQMHKRADEWRILRRELVIDWFKAIAEPPTAGQAPVTYAVRGARRPSDPSYELFGIDAGAPCNSKVRPRS